MARRPTKTESVQIKKFDVSIEHCTSYNQDIVDYAIAKSLENLHWEIEEGSKVLLKPNLLIAKTPESAVLTHPSIVEALIILLQKKKCDIIVGDSSGFNTAKAFELSGILELCNRYNVKAVCFEKEEKANIKCNGAVLKNISLTKIIDNVDCIINIPKMKTHTLMKITGAVKNCYGFVPGKTKSIYHTKGITEERFGELLTDIYSCVKPKISLNIMDAVVGMEGEGPSNGVPKKTGLILASRDAIALDIVQAKIMGFEPELIHTITSGIARGLSVGYGDIDNIHIIGNKDLMNNPAMHYVKPSAHAMLNSLKNIVTSALSIKPVMIPECDTAKCKKCGICAKVCPKQCITYAPYPTFDRKKCIKCYCCQENCPHNAIFLKKE